MVLSEKIKQAKPRKNFAYDVDAINQRRAAVKLVYVESSSSRHIVRTKHSLR